MKEDQIQIMSELDDCIIIFSDDVVYKVIDGEPVEAEFNGN